MSTIRQNTFEILNPLPGGASYTTRRSALQFVRRGLAVFEGDRAIRFLDQDRRIERADSGDVAHGEFWWRLGRSGGVVQQIGSAVQSRIRSRPNGDKSV